MEERRRRVVVRWVVGMVAATCVSLAGAIWQPATAQSELRGRLHVVWDAEPTAANPDGVQAFIVGDDGRATQLLLTLEPDRTPDYLTWHGRRVEAQVDPVLPDDVRRPRARLLQIRTIAGSATAAPAAPGIARLDFITVLCRFADDPPPAVTPDRVARVMGPDYPGMLQYYAELSWNPDIMAGSRVTPVWYDLPEPREFYIQGTSTAFGALAADCTNAADAAVDFSAYYGINLQFSGALGTRSTAPYDVLSYGGSWTLTLDGETRSWGMTWLSGTHAENYVVYAHEMGHALGWPHSSGRYGSSYDSNWDVMSRGYLRREAPWGWLTVHTIAAHKNARGWIPPARRWEPAPGAEESGVIVRTAQSPDHGYLIAVISRDSNRFHTAEVREHAGHDTPLPGQAIVLHEVEFGRAWVVDATGNGNPNDAGAQWTPGETFRDSLAGFTLHVDSAVAGGFAVTIVRGWRLDVAVIGDGAVRSDGDGINCQKACSRLFPTRGATVVLTTQPASGGVFAGWTGACGGTGPCRVTMDGSRNVRAVFDAKRVLTPDAVFNHLLGVSTTLTSGDLRYLDLLGNGNGRFDIGDVVSWLIDTNMVRAEVSAADVLGPLIGPGTP